MKGTRQSLPRCNRSKQANNTLERVSDRALPAQYCGTEPAAARGESGRAPPTDSSEESSEAAGAAKQEGKGGAMPEVPAVRARGVRKRYGATIALDGVDLTVEHGEV